MPIGVRFTYKYKGLPKITRRETGRMQKRAYKKLGRRWHRRNRPRHFTRRGAVAYRYAKRTRNYVRDKLRKHGHNRPLEFSGDSKRNSRFANIRSTSKGVRVAMTLLRVLNLRHPKSRINMAEEMRRVTGKEARELRDVGNRDIEGRLKRYRRRRFTASK